MKLIDRARAAVERLGRAPLWAIITPTGNIGPRGGIASPENLDEYLKALRLFPTVAACIDKIIAAAVDVPLRTLDRQTRQPRDVSRFDLLLDKPNDTQGRTEYLASALQQFLLHGSVTQALDPNPLDPTSVRVIPSNRVRPIPGKSVTDPLIMSYEITMEFGGSVVIPAELVCRAKFPHPSSSIHGLSRLTELEPTLKLIFEMYRHQTKMLERGARVGGVLLLKGGGFPIGREDKEREELERKIEARYTGDNAYRTMVIRAAEAEWKDAQASSRDMEFGSLWDFLRREIMNVYQVPPGLFDSKDVNRSNMREQRALLYTDAVRPVLSAFCDAWNAHPCVINWGERIEPNWDAVEALQPNQLEESQAMRNLVGRPMLTINEARERMGFEPVADGYELATSLGPEILSGMESYPTGSEMVAPPAATANEDEDEDDEDERKRIRIRAREERIADALSPLLSRDALTEAAVKAAQKGDDERRRRWAARAFTVTGRERYWKQRMATIFRDLEGEVLATLAAISRANVPPGWANISFFDSKSFRATLQSNYQDLSGGDVAAAHDDVAKILSGPVPEVGSPALSKYIDGRADSFSQHVSQTTREAMRDLVRDAVDANATVDELRGMLEDHFEWMSRVQAELIARTEVGGIYNAASMDFMQQAGVRFHEWVSERDDRVRLTHEEADGQVVPIGDDFVVGEAAGPHPGAMGDPAEDCNCRCVTDPVETEEVEE